MVGVIGLTAPTTTPNNGKGDKCHQSARAKQTNDRHDDKKEKITSSTGVHLSLFNFLNYLFNFNFIIFFSFSVA